MTCGMKMYLNWDVSVPHVFFKWWTATTPFSFGLSLVIIFVLCFLFEGLVAYRAAYDAHLNDTLTLSTKSRRLSMGQHLCRSGLFAVSNGYSLFIMMIFMLFNGYMCLACVAGAFAGHLTFAVALPGDGGSLPQRPRSCCD